MIQVSAPSPFSYTDGTKTLIGACLAKPGAGLAALDGRSVRSAPVGGPFIHLPRKRHHCPHAGALHSGCSRSFRRPHALGIGAGSRGAPGAVPLRFDLRVSLGYHKRDLPDRIGGALDETFPFIISTDEPERVPDRDHLLIQVGLRRSADMSADDAIRAVTQHFGWRASPLVGRVDYWAEADLMSDYGAAHRISLRAIRDLLPPAVRLIGSDYCSTSPEVHGVAS